MKLGLWISLARLLSNVFKMAAFIRADDVIVKNAKGKTPVWKHFGLIIRKGESKRDKNVTSCKISKAVIKCSGGTTNLQTHLRRHHLNVSSPTQCTVRPIEAVVVKHNTDLQDSVKKQQSINDAFPVLEPYKSTSEKAQRITGNVDSVRCYFCGIGLRNWDPEDDPWVEHARWAPKCFHVLNKKGQEFVQLVQAAVRQQEMQEALDQSASIADDVEFDCPPQHGLPNEIAPSSGPSRAEKKNPLLTEAAQSVLAMGYLPKVVKRAVDIVLENKGWKGMTGENIANVIFEIEDSGEVKPEQLLVPVKKFGSNSRTEDKPGKNFSQLECETNEMKERILCKICCENTVSIVFLPCGHLVSCAQCSPALKNCPVCRILVKGTVRVCFS